jgi:hypothetical protein
MARLKAGFDTVLRAGHSIARFILVAVKNEYESVSRMFCVDPSKSTRAMRKAEVVRD